jgi:phosphatidylglycerophosphatase A
MGDDDGSVLGGFLLALAFCFFALFIVVKGFIIPQLNRKATGKEYTLTI